MKVSLQACMLPGVDSSIFLRRAMIRFWRTALPEGKDDQVDDDGTKMINMPIAAITITYINYLDNR